VKSEFGDGRKMGSKSKGSMISFPSVKEDVEDSKEGGIKQRWEEVDEPAPPPPPPASLVAITVGKVNEGSEFPANPILVYPVPEREIAS